MLDQLRPINITSHYDWSQTDTKVELYIPVFDAKNISPKQYTLDIQSHSLQFYVVFINDKYIREAYNQLQRKSSVNQKLKYMNYNKRLLNGYGFQSIKEPSNLQDIKKETERFLYT
ncbi:hypothetical protein BJ944DRAFT_244112 [Cunninghamella echinulata]|nr:hypothetical protein BJ944DRAFT_244112 [Cunninghamella echinulata]